MMRTKAAYGHRANSGQALIEIAVFGAVLIFLIGVIIRSHVSTSFSQNYKVRAFKMALKESFQGFQAPNPHTSRNSANILFVEDRIAPDLNKYNSLDRSPFIATATATMTNLLMYPVDQDEFSQNIPIQDVFINGQHFEFTTKAFVLRTLYNSRSECNRLEPIDGQDLYANGRDALEYDRCLRQIKEKNGDVHAFYSLVANGTKDFKKSNGGFDYLRGIYNGKDVSGDEPPDDLQGHMAWQWTKTDGRGDNSKIDFGSEDSKAYPSFDTSGSLREQEIYYITRTGKTSNRCKINDNDHLISITACPELANGIDMTDDGSKFDGAIRAVAVLDPQLGDIDSTYDSAATPGPRPGFTEEMQIYTNIGTNGQSNNGRASYLEITETGLYDPVNHKFVRSKNSKDKTDLVSRVFQLSNDTGRMCGGKYEDGEDNPVQACSDCLGANFSVTCFDPNTRKLYIRANIWDRNSRAWYTNASKGL